MRPLLNKPICWGAPLLGIVAALGAGCPTLFTLVTITPASVEIAVGETAILTATSTSPSDQQFVWTSSNTSVATVTQAGIVAGVSMGQVVVSATGAGSGVMGTAQVTVGAGGGGGEEQPGEATYVGSWACGACHNTARWDYIYSNFLLSGHPHKIKKVENGQPPEFPYNFPPAVNGINVPNPPAGFTWNHITYLIGGYYWKARFMDHEGYILTDSTDPAEQRLTQFNLWTQGWASYDPTAGGRKAYTCGACHTTGWKETGPDGLHQDNMPGIYGTWAELGVQCEACHGPGSNHILSMSRRDILLDTSSGLCGTCHYRDSQHRILVKGGFIQHHEQYDEMISGRHRVLECVVCHDPHKSTVYTPASAIRKQCTDCHTRPVLRASMTHLDCIDCHMPWAAKSAVELGPHQADVRSHIFGIRTTAETREEGMFYEEGGKTYAQGKLTLDFACMWCHDGVRASSRTMAQLATAAPFIHYPSP